MEFALDKRSPVPLYYQLAEHIREQIRQGCLHSGDRVPSERELSDQAGVSRMTVRQAVAYLVRDATLVVRHGRGTFVAEPKLTYDALHLLGFTEEMMSRGGQPSSRVLQQSVVAPPLHIAASLGLAPGDEVVQVDRLRFLDNVPLLLESSFLPAALCPGLEAEDLAAQSLYTLLRRRYKLALGCAQQTIEAIRPSARERQLLAVDGHAPMLLVDGTTYLTSGTPIEYFRAIYRGDRFKFQVASRAEHGAGDLELAPQLRVVLA